MSRTDIDSVREGRQEHGVCIFCMCCRARCVWDLGWHCSKDCMCLLYVSTVMSSQSVSCRGDFFFRVVLWCVLSRMGRHLKGALPLWQSKCLSVRLCAWRSLSSRAYSRWSKQAQQTSTSALHVSQHSRQTVRMFDFLCLCLTLWWFVCLLLPIWMSCIQLPVWLSHCLIDEIRSEYTLP